MAAQPLGAQRGDSLVDWPTLLVIYGFWAALVALVLWGHTLPTAFVVVALACLGGLAMSLQHEVIHGHPTRLPWFNWLMVAAPVGLLQPFSRYRADHLAHHRSDITNPAHDPESFYVLPATWAHAGRLHRMVLHANRTLAFRLTGGVLLASARMLRAESATARNDRRVRTAWLLHMLGCGLVIGTISFSTLPMWVYLVGFVYGGAAVSALRSFVEHLGVDNDRRSAIVHSNWFFGLLFLNNNLHDTHHQLPGAAWFRLPELTATLGAHDAVAAGAGVYRGYAAIARKHMFRPFCQPVHPLSDTIRT